MERRVETTGCKVHSKLLGVSEGKGGMGESELCRYSIGD